jgi:hypothetical protein
MMSLSDINLVAVLATTVVQMFLGMTWYSPKVFGTAWMKLTGIAEDHSAKAMQKSLTIGTIGTFVGVCSISLLLSYLQPDSLKYALKFGALLWLAVTVGESLNAIAWEKRPVGLIKINAGYQLVSILVSVALLYKWPW